MELTDEDVTAICQTFGIYIRLYFLDTGILPLPSEQDSMIRDAICNTPLPSKMQKVVTITKRAS